MVVEFLAHLRLQLDVLVELAAPFGGANDVDRPMPGERDRPGHRFASGRIVERRFFPDLDEDLLEHIFRGLLVAEQTVGNREENARKTIVELLETRSIALADAAEKLDFLELRG